MQKYGYDNKDLYPFQAGELLANVILSPRKDSCVKMQLTFCSLPCNTSKKRDRGPKTAAICKCSTRGSENLPDSSNEGSRGGPEERPSWDTAEPSQRGTSVALLLRKQTSLFAPKAAHILFFSYKQGGLRKSRTDYQQAHQLQKTIPICSQLFPAPHEDAAEHGPLQVLFSRQRTAAWYSFPNPVEREK